MSADSSIYSTLGILSVVGVMVRISNHFYGQEFSSLSKSPTLFSADDHFFFAWNGAYPMANNVRGTHFIFLLMLVAAIQLRFRFLDRFRLIKHIEKIREIFQCMSFT